MAPTRLRVLLIGSHHTERIERGVERALQRAGHRTLLIDDRRLRRNIGLALTQRWILAAARRFKPDYVFFSKSLGLTLETAAELARGRPSGLWYQDPQWYGDAHLPDIAHTIAVGRLSRHVFRDGLRARMAGDGTQRQAAPLGRRRRHSSRWPPRRHFASDVAFIGTGPGVSHGGAGFAPERAEFLASVASQLGWSPAGRVWGEWLGELARSLRVGRAPGLRPGSLAGVLIESPSCWASTRRAPRARPTTPPTACG